MEGARFPRITSIYQNVMRTTFIRINPSFYMHSVVEEKLLAQVDYIVVCILHGSGHSVA